MIPGVTVTPVATPGSLNLNLQDGVAGVVMTGAGTGTLALLKPIKVVSLSDAVSQGVTSAVEPEAYKLVKEFYSEAPVGSLLYLMLVANTVTMVSLCDITNTINGAKKLVDFSQGTIRGLSIMRTPAGSYTPATDEFIDSDAHLCLTNALAFQKACFNAFTPLRIFIGCRINDAASNTVFTPSTAANNAVCMVIGDTAAGGLTAMGIILGRFAATTAEINIGRNSDGALAINNFYIGALPTVPPADGSAWYQQLNALINTGYVTITTYAQTAGYFISDDPLATTGDITNVNNLADGRIQDDSAIVSYQTYIKELKGNVDIDSDGNIDAVSIKDLESKVYNNILFNMGNKISGNPTVYIDPAQSPDTPLQIEVGVTRKGCLRQINVQLALS